MSIITDLIIKNETPTGNIDGVNKEFILSKPPNPESSLKIFINGLLKIKDVDFTLYNLTITFSVAPSENSIIKCSYRYVNIAELYLSIQRIIDAGNLASMDENDINGSNIINGENWSDDTAANAAQAAADAAQATADGKIVTFVQNTEPTAEGVGDLWIDSSNTNKLYRWNGTSWILVTDTDIEKAITDAAGAQATADGKVTTFYQDSEPTAEGVGDFWIDTNDNNKPYRWSGSSWIAIDNPVADWSKIVDDNGNRPEDNATENTGDLADLDVVDTDQVNDGAISLEKFSNDKRIIISCFESLDGWDVWDNTELYLTFGGLRINSPNVTDDFNNITAMPTGWTPLDWSKNMFWQSSIKVSSTTNQIVLFGAGGSDILQDLSGFGFKIVNGTLYCYHCVFNEGNDEVDYTTQEITGITLTDWNIYRVIYNQSAGTLKFYINGVLKHTFSSGLPTSSDNYDTLAMYEIQTKEDVKKYLYASDLLFSIDR